MSSPIEIENAREPDSLARDRRKHERHPGKALVEIVRETDSRRIGVPVSLINVSIAGIGLLSDEPFARDERVKVVVRNTIRRFLKKVHGIVRWSQPIEDGKFRIGIELNARFSVHDLQNLKQVGMAGDAEQKVWI